METEVQSISNTDVVKPVQSVDGKEVVANAQLTCPPSTPTGETQEGQDKKEKEPTTFDAAVKKALKGKNHVPIQGYPRFSPSWEICPTAAKTYKSFPKSQEIAPDLTLAEFISTSAAFHGVKKQGIRALEWDLLKVFTNNIMPANAAAWYMAKRRFFLNKPFMQQLLPTVLSNYPMKFSVDPEQRTVVFLEDYNKESAKWKMNYLVHQGLFAYFSHKVDEYGVYFFDPLYYITTEPFHANLRLATNYYGQNKNKLISAYFKKYKDQFHFTQHSQFLVSISKVKVKREVNCIGVIRSMINNDYGIIQFQTSTDGSQPTSESQTALFHAKSLFKDGYVYDRDPLKLNAIKFDGFEIPGNPKHEGKEYTWYASLVWVGRKTSPKFCTSLDTLQSSQFFKNHAVTLEELAAGVPKAGEEFTKPKIPKDQYMKKGEVISITKNGAIAQVKNKEDKVFIPGWPVKLDRRGSFLTTPSNDNIVISRGDTIAFYLDENEKTSSFVGTGSNVIVLVNGKSGNKAKVADEKLRGNRKGKARNQSESSKKSRNSGRRSTRYSSEASSGGRKRSVSRSYMNSKTLIQFLTKDELAEEYDSDVDPSFIPPPIYEIDLDFDEYSDGDIPIDEKDALILESDEKFDITGLVPPPKEVEEGEIKETEPVVEKAWLKLVLFDEIPPEETSEDESNDKDFNLPIGVVANLDLATRISYNLVSEDEAKDGSDEKKEDSSSDKEEMEEVNVIPEDEVALLLEEASEPIETLMKRLEEEKKSFEEGKLQTGEPQPVAALVEA